MSHCLDYYWIIQYWGRSGIYTYTYIHMYSKVEVWKVLFSNTAGIRKNVIIIYLWLSSTSIYFIIHMMPPIPYVQQIASQMYKQRRHKAHKC